MIPSQPDREDNQTHSELQQSRTERSQRQSDRDQTGSEHDQRAADLDQCAADLDQQAADDDQAASDRDLARGSDREVHDNSRAVRDRTTEARRATSAQRRRTAHERETRTGQRDATTGLEQLQRDIDRARQVDRGLIAAYIDVDVLRGSRDGHVGNGPLERIAAALQSSLRPDESIVRLGSDEFVCTFSDATVDMARQRFDQITAGLDLRPADGRVSVGFAELARGDSPMDLVDRADRALITSRDAQIRGAPVGT